MSVAAEVKVRPTDHGWCVRHAFHETSRICTFSASTSVISETSSYLGGSYARMCDVPLVGLSRLVAARSPCDKHVHPDEDEKLPSVRGWGSSLIALRPASMWQLLCLVSRVVDDRSPLSDAPTYLPNVTARTERERDGSRPDTAEAEHGRGSNTPRRPFSG